MAKEPYLSVIEQAPSKEKFDIKKLENYLNLYIILNFISVILFFASIKLEIPLFGLIVLVIFFYITSKLYLKKLGIEKMADLIDTDFLIKYPKGVREYYIAAVPLWGLVSSLGMAFGLVFVLSYFSNSSLVFIVPGILYCLSFIIFLIIRGIVIEAPMRVKKYENISYKIPLSSLLLSLIRVIVFIVVVGVTGIAIGAIISLFWKGSIIANFVPLVAIPLFLKFRNIIFFPILSWARDNIKCPDCSRGIEKVNIGISEFSLLKLIIKCESCQKRFDLGTGFYGKNLSFYRKQ